MIISIEGIDGAGKNTLVRALTSRIDASTLTFPRYDTSIHAQLAARALHGQMGDLVDSAHGMATLFALDRYGAREVLDRYADSDEVLLLDRYVASNAAYTAARLKDDAAFDWVYDLEFGQLGLPVPHLQVLLGTSVDDTCPKAGSLRRNTHPGCLRKRWRTAGPYFCRLPAVSRETVGQSVAD